MKEKSWKAMAMFFAAVLLLGGCGASDKSAAQTENFSMTNASSADYGGGWETETAMDTSGEEKTEEVSPEMAAEEAGTEESLSSMTNASSADYGGGWETETAMDTSGEEKTEEVSPEMAAEEAGTEESLSEKDLSSRKLIKRVSLSMETKSFDTMKQKMEEAITSCGGYIESSSFDDPQGGEYYRYYSITARIPSEKLDSFVSEAGNLGTVTNKSENVEDVTLDYVDKTAYKESLQVEYERVMELLEEAKDLEQILALESKLSQLRYEINSYESQLRTYDNLIDYSTVNIYISEVEYEQKAEDTIGSRISNGFQSSLYTVRDFFVNLFVGIVANLPVIVLVGIVAALGVIGVVKLWKRKKKRKQEKKDNKENQENKEKPKA